MSATTWRARARTKLERGQATAAAHMASAVDAWETDARVSPEEARALRAELVSPGLQAVLPHLGGLHVAIALLLPFPLASLCRAGWTIWMLLAASVRLLLGRIDREGWSQAWSLHNPVIALFAALPVVGGGAYLLSRPVRRNRLLARVTLDAILAATPWRLYERSGARRLVTLGRPAAATP